MPSDDGDDDDKDGGGDDNDDGVDDYDDGDDDNDNLVCSKALCRSKNCPSSPTSLLWRWSDQFWTGFLG